MQLSDAYTFLQKGFKNYIFINDNIVW